MNRKLTGAARERHMPNLLMFIYQYRGKFRRPLVQNTLAALLIAFSCTIVAQFIHRLLLSDGHPSMGALWARAGLGLLFFLAYFLCIRAYTKNAMRTGHRVTTDLRLRLCDHLRYLPLSFFRKNTSSKITSTLVTDMFYTETVFSVYLYEIAACLLIPGMLLTVFLILDFRVASGVLFVLVFSLPFLLRAYISASGSGLTFIEARANVDHTVQQYIEGIRELKGADRTGDAFRPFVTCHDRFQRISLKIEARLGLYCQTYIGILELIFVVIFVLGSVYFIQGTLPMGILLFLLCMSSRLIEPLQLLGAYLTEFRFALGSARRVLDIFDQEPLPVHPGFTMPADNGFTFDSVYFSYDGTPVISNFCLHAPEGSVTALVGASGSGKTTVANLLLRFWDVGRGRICIGGTDIRTMEQAQLSSLFSVVFQDVYLFNDTIMNNIRMGRADAPDDAVIKAARLACCHDFIMALDRGYHTPVGQNGAMLSGGERQRIAIARAILAKAPILVLDEATASIDPENELQIQRGLNNLIQGRTLLVIAHRLSTIRHADRIVVLKKGGIEEQGTHEQLMDRQGAYYQLWNAQKKIKSWSVR